jgi:hypothetical protein
MANKIQFKRGNKSKLPILDSGEPGFVLDTEEFYIGKGDKNVKILTEKDQYTNTNVENYISAGSGIGFNNGTITNIDRGSVALTQHLQNYNHNDINFLRIFITDIQPANDEKHVTIYYNDPPNDNSIKKILTDDTEVYVTFEWDRLDEYRGTPKINNSPVINYTERTSVTYIHTVLTNITGTSEIVCEYNDNQYVVEVEFDAAPLIENANFTGGYPNLQTELKLGDIVAFFVRANTEFTTIQIDDYGACEEQIFDFSATREATVSLVVRDLGNSPVNVGVRFRIQKNTGTWSEWHNTEDDGSIDGYNLVTLNNLHPSINIVDISYPAGQGALKNAESAGVNNIISNFTTVSYQDVLGQLNINNPSTYETNKIISRSNGDYNTNLNNLKITAIRSQNNSITTKSTIVKIANIPAQLEVTHNSKLRSGGNNNTEVQNHNISIISNQQLLFPPTLETNIGSWQNPSFSGGPFIYHNQLQVHDDLIKGIYPWGNIGGFNLANIQTTINSGQTNVTIQGFVSRELTLGPFQNETFFNTEAVDYSNIIFHWDFKPSVQNQSLVGTSLTPVPNNWCLNSLNTNPTIVRILDTSATNSSSKSSTITIEETI